MDVEVGATEEGDALLPVRVQPGARRAGAAGSFDGCLRLSVTAPPEGGRANDAVCRLAAELFGLRASSVEVVRGHSSRRKTLRLALAPDAVRARLSALLKET